MLDVLCEISGRRGYEELLPHTTDVDTFGMRLKVLDLPTLIQVKSEAGRPKDLLMIPILIATWEELKKGR